MHFRSLLFCLMYSIVAEAQIDTAAISQKLSQSAAALGKDVAVVLYKDGKVVYKKEMGKFNLKTQQQIGATSQWLTTALVMIFVQEGKLSLDDKVGQYIPLFEKYYKGYITLRHCLTHYTGIKTEQSALKLFQKNNFKSLEEQVNDFASKKDIGTNAGTEFNYSNMGFNIAARLLEVISKKTFDRLALEKLIRPLSMRNTTFTNENYNDAINPAMGARSSATDLSNFMSMLLNKGTFNGKQILTEASVSEMLSLQAKSNLVKGSPKQTETLDYALGGWILEQNANPTAYSSPSLAGTWPILDVCRGYALTIFTKELGDEKDRKIAMDIKALVDDGIKTNCQ